MNSMDSQANDPVDSALNRLVNREEVLQICYWYQGEGFGDVFDAARIEAFLACDRAGIDAAFRELSEQQYMDAVSEPVTGYRFTDSGKRIAGRLFSESFAEFQKGGHGECDAGCCDDDDHSQCGDHCTLH